MFKRMQVIVNPAAGQDKPFLGVLNKTLKDAGIDYELVLTKDSGDGRRFAEEAVASGEFDVVAVHGGDGTVMEAASGLMNTSMPLVILPGGSANVMSIELGIPSDLGQAIGLVCSEENYVIRSVDMGCIGDAGVFLLRVTTGFTAEATKNTEREAKNRLGSLAYVFSALRGLTNAPFSKYKLILDGEEIETEGVTCMIANSANLGIPGLTLAKTVDVSDGLLDVLVIRSADFNQLLTVAANTIGIAQSLPHWQAREITLIADPPQIVECDGEIIHSTPLKVSVLPQALKVVVPKITLANVDTPIETGSTTANG